MRTRRPRALQLVRYSIQTTVAAYVLVIVIANTTGERWAANLHTICPFGGVVNLYTYFVEGGYVAKLHAAVFVMLLALLVGLILTGKSFCGWICPLGSIQQGLGWIGRRLWPRAYNKLPRWLDGALQYLKWAVLVWVLVQTARTGRLIFQDWDPYFTLYHIWTDEIALTGYVVTAATVVISFFVPRPFCRYACPLGAFNGIFNSFSFIRIKRDAQTCTDCGRCTKVCPVNIDLCASTTIRSIECTRCLQCIEACPQNTRGCNTLGLHTWFSGLVPSGRSQGTDAPSPASAKPGRSKRVPTSAWVFAAIAIAAFVLPILITNLTGDFKIAGGGRGSGNGGGRQELIEPGLEGIEEGLDGAAMNVDYQQIRGSTTLGAMQFMGADIGDFLAEFDLPQDIPLSTRLRDLAEQYGLPLSEVRAYVDHAAR